MKITTVERISVDAGHVTRAGRYMRAGGTGNWSIVELCKVTTDSGLTGWGETIPHYTWGRVTDAAAARVIGRTPAELMWDDGLGCGLQQALMDLAGKALGVPAYRLIGAKVRDWCPLAWWAWDMTPEDWVAETRDALAAGYASFKFKARPWRDLRAATAAISRATPGHVTFDLDFNSWLLTAGQAAQVLLELEAIPQVHIFETPIFQWDVAGNRSLRAKIHRPIAMHFDQPPFLTAVAEGVCDGFVISGGAATVKRQAELAAEANMPFWLQLVGTGITTAFAAHLGAALRWAQWPAITCLNTYADDLLVQPLQIERGCVRVPEAPGLGIEVDADALARLRRTDVSPKELPRIIHTVRWADGRTAQYMERGKASVGYERDFLDGNQPLFEPGVSFTSHEDDGSAAFDRLYTEVQRARCLVTNP
ncbi:MAG: enolase [Actinobacteria bacterium]|nr:enolase [Actinomycetota bacterium]